MRRARRSPTLRGRQAEDLACVFLKQRGLKLLERNFHSRWGEIDLVMKHAETVVFVEVRYRTSSRFGTPAETVDYHKRQRLLATAEVYLQTHDPHTATRFDVVAIRGDGAVPGEEIDWIANAFGE